MKYMFSQICACVPVCKFYYFPRHSSFCFREQWVNELNQFSTSHSPFPRCIYVHYIYILSSHTVAQKKIDRIAGTKA